MSGYYGQMSQDQGITLQGIARRAMLQYGLEPDWPPQAEAELAGLRQSQVDREAVHEIPSLEQPNSTEDAHGPAAV